MGWTNNLTGMFTGSTGKHAGDDAYNDLAASRDKAIGYLDPWAKAGGSALAPLTGLLTGKSYDYATGESTDLNQAQRNDLFYKSPGYQFSLDQALKAMNNSFAAKGNLLSGGAAKEMGQYASGLASQNYNDFLGQLFQLAGMGQQADTSKANVVTNLASPMAEARYSSTIAKNIAGGNLMELFTAGYGIGGGAGKGQGQSLGGNSAGTIGGGAAAGGTGSAGMSSGATYNPAIFQSAGAGSTASSSSLMMAAA